MSDIKRCPFCGGEGEHLSVYSPPHEQTDLYRIKCQGTCGVCGPVKDGRDAAAFAWNQRYFTIPNSVAAALAAKDAEIARLEDELYDAQHGPWPEWAEKILKVVRSYSGYDGYDDVTDGIDLVGEVEEALSELYSEAERLRAKLKEVTGAAL